MKPKKILIAVVFVLVLALLGVTWDLIQMKRKSDALLSAASERQTTIRNDLRRTIQEIAKLEQAHSVLAASVDLLKSAPAAPPRHVPMPSLQALFAANPLLAGLWIKSVAATLDKNYGPLFQALSLTPERAEKLKRIMVDRQAQRQDIYDTAELSGLAPSDPAVTTLVQQADSRAHADETSLLGDAGYRQMQEYERTVPIRYNFVQGLAADVAFTDPLSAQQGEQLTQAVANSSPLYQSGGDVGDLWHGGNIDWAAMDRQVQTILTPGQFVAWQQNRARLDAQLQTTYNQAAKADGISP